MKIIKLERRTINGEPIEQDALKKNAENYRDWWHIHPDEDVPEVGEEIVDGGGDTWVRVV